MTFQVAELNVGSKPDLYAQLATQVSSLLEGERNFIANAANFSALLYHSLPEVNWVGFYLYTTTWWRFSSSLLTSMLTEFLKL
ncbi:MAG TPA: hypothetical protein VJ124_17175 [Pyrinomonadaceae bacterium]|nr:hypothetical protein [Pyrinomonadaceae bacterium]